VTVADARPARFHRVHRRRGTHSYAYVLLLVFASFLFTAIAPDTSWARGVLVLFESATLIAALWTSHAGPLQMRVGLIGVGVAVAVAEISVGGRFLEGVSGVINGLLVVAVMAVVGRGVAQEGEVNEQSVIGAVCIYLLIGLFFVFIYGLVAVIGPGPFFVQGTDGGPALRRYFSFVTLTTVGYGDYTARTNTGHMFAVVEALLGQLYLVTIVAVLVSRMSARRV
jgi:hypothetical protein